jgi:hypothetical protein
MRSRLTPCSCGRAELTCDKLCVVGLDGLLPARGRVNSAFGGLLDRQNSGGKLMCIGDDCNGGCMDRRSFLAGAAATVASLAAQQGQEAKSQTKQPETRVLDDSTVQHGREIFKHNGMDTIDGYLARPKAEGAYPAVLVIAGNKISEEYIPNTCVALALCISRRTPGIGHSWWPLHRSFAVDLRRTLRTERRPSHPEYCSRSRGLGRWFRLEGRLRHSCQRWLQRQHRPGAGDIL